MAQITKLDVICMVITKNGPMTKKDILREVARIEGKPFRPTSNGDYFASRSPRRFYVSANRVSLRAQGYIQIAGKKRNAIVWGLTPKGAAHIVKVYDNIARVKAVLARLVEG